MNTARSFVRFLLKRYAFLMDNSARRVLRPTRGNIHSIRKNLKKARAMLKLMKKSSGITRKFYRRENRALRDIGRQFSSIRDSDVLHLTWRGFHSRTRLGKSVKSSISQLLNSSRRSEREDLLDMHSRRRLQLQLLEAKKRFSSDLLKVTDSSLETAFRKLYNRSRKACRADWRKRNKDLQYNLDFLRNASRSSLTQSTADATRRISKELGEIMDLHLLDSWLEQQKDSLPSIRGAAAQVRASIRKRLPVVMKRASEQYSPKSSEWAASNLRLENLQGKPDQ
jgi:CHAD domain-containing protein